MKLAIDALNLRNDLRGMGRVVRSVLRAAVASGVEVTLLTREKALWDGDPAAESLARVRLAPLRSASLRAAYDAVWYPWNGIRFGAASPTLAHIHDTFALEERQRDWIARRRVRGPLWRAARDATQIATDSEWSRGRIVRELGVKAGDVVVIPLAPDPLFSPGEVDAKALPHAPYVLLVGGGEPRKNARFLVSSFAAAFPNGDVTLVAVGSFSPEAAAEAARRGIMVVREDASDERLRDLYRGAACVAVPSLAEGFGLVAVEAQASGAPVIASNRSALPEAAGDAAILADPEDTAAWRDALRSTVRDPAVAARLRGLSAARWASAPRDGPANAIVDALRRLAAGRDPN